MQPARASPLPRVWLTPSGESVLQSFNRDVPMADALFDVLSAWKSLALVNEQGLVFITREGVPYRSDGMLALRARLPSR